jgi:hypothetical protein
MKKSGIELHADRFGAQPHPAVNVKVRGLPSADRIAGHFGCSAQVATRALEFAFESAQERFWEQAEAVAAEIFAGWPCRVYSEGRSGGWLAVHGLPEVESWDAMMVSKWARLAEWCRNEIADGLAENSLVEEIEAYHWHKEGAEKFNFIDGKNGVVVCLADLKAQARTAGFGPVIR